ncbi:hypothetical protein LPJ61_002322 [Coemansia biformis]|uniref:Phosphotransferase n=1 Tax=Coemansia biformis TaxID=1286918 RepID=A0A9W8CXB5_9FUNG|nr:hypothetical protein LPJ61_002322 [Coemansia biformis]
MTDMYAIKGASAAQERLLTEIADKFHVADEYLMDIADETHRYVVNGLKGDNEPKGLPNWVSYIKFAIANDIREARRDGEPALGLTINTSAHRLKIASFRFVPGAPDVINKQVYRIEKEFPSVMELFEEVATNIMRFLNSHNVESRSGKPISLGMSIDLPLAETSKSGGRVVCQSETCSRFYMNMDIAQALNAALLRKHLPVRVTSTINCVISTMVAAQYRFPSTCMALILNHGINASYYEAAAKIEKIAGTELGSSHARVAINTELASFGENSEVIKPTMWDNRVDRESANTGHHIFEKLVADKYLGEIVRNLITDFRDDLLIFPRDADMSTLSEPYSFYTSYMVIMDDCSDDLHEVGDLLKANFNIAASIVDRQIVRALCHIVAMRAAKLVGGAVAGLVKRATEAMSVPAPAVISISGQLTEMNQPYVNCTIASAQKLLGAMGLDRAEFNILGEDGYTVGAALSSFSK